MATITSRKNKNGQITFYILVSSGYSESGQQIRKHTSWTAPLNMSEEKAKKEAQRQAILFEEQVHKDEVLNGNIKFEELSHMWIEQYAKKNLRKKTVATDEFLLGIINKGIGHIRIDKMKPLHLIEYYDSLSKPVIEYKFVLSTDLRKTIKAKKLTLGGLTLLAGLEGIICQYTA